MTQANFEQFRDLCAHTGMAVTHQRRVLYEVMQTMHGHPSPEEVYAKVKKRIPSISLATVYKNLHLFIENGIFREVSVHHGSLRVETNHRPHHHLVCTVCRSIMDVEEEELGPLPGQTGILPGGFLAERFSVDILGRCVHCQSTDPRTIQS